MEEVGKILPAVFRKRVRLGGVTLVEILAPLWPRVAGKQMAQHSQPVAFEAGTLTLITDCPSWAGQLRQMAEEIRAEINSFLGAPVVKKLRVQRRAALDPPGPTVLREDLSPTLDAGKFEQVDPEVQLDPQIAQIVSRSFTKYFARKGRGVR